jgi:hypothetical protein
LGFILAREDLSSLIQGWLTKQTSVNHLLILPLRMFSPTVLPVLMKRLHRNMQMQLLTQPDLMLYQILRTLLKTALLKKQVMKAQRRQAMKLLRKQRLRKNRNRRQQKSRLKTTVLTVMPTVKSSRSAQTV